MTEFRKLMAANRGEIAIRVFRSAHELGIRTVAIYSHEDRFATHRLKADEAYEIGRPGEPIRSYLDIEAIVELAKAKDVDAIHPGYGFLSENAEFARACERAGIVFVGPRPELLDLLGDKVAARKLAREAGIPVLSGSDAPVQPGPEAHALAESLGYPVIIKASMGGGGRGMRVVESADGLDAAIDQARREAGTAFGVPDVFIEKFLRRAKHIEVQILGDRHGNLLHLYERDCSVQRRHQKIVEIAPAPDLDPSIRQAICDAAVAISRHVGYENAGTVEFLLDVDAGAFYFIEVNPRIQVEHTVTEIVTGVDLVKSQILIAGGAPLSDPEIDLPDQSAVKVEGFALQCRVTTEDPENKFTPDYGRITHYRSVGGLGIRTDGGPAHHGRDHHAVLRLAAGEDQRLRPAVHRRGPPAGAGPPGVPRAGRQDERPVPAQRRHPSHVPLRGLHDAVPRRDPRAVPLPRPAGPGDAAAQLRGRGHGQRIPRGDAAGRLCARRPSPRRRGSIRSSPRRRARASGSRRWGPTRSPDGSASSSRSS